MRTEQPESLPEPCFHRNGGKPDASGRSQNQGRNRCGKEDSDDADFQYGYCMISFSVDRRVGGTADERERVFLEIPLQKDVACLGSAIFSEADYLAISAILFVPNADRNLVPHRDDGSVDWEAIAFDPELAKRHAKINGINAKGRKKYRQ